MFLLQCAIQSPIGHNHSAGRNANTAAGKTGKAAHYVAKESGKAARAAGRKLAQAAREARDGWEESAHQDQQKAKQ